MTSISDPRAILTALIVVTALICLLKRADPVVLMSRWGYALRRAIWIAGQMAWEAPSEFRHQWKAQRPADAQELAKLEERYPAGPEEAR